MVSGTFCCLDDFTYQYFIITHDRIIVGAKIRYVFILIIWFGSFHIYELICVIGVIFCSLACHYCVWVTVGVGGAQLGALLISFTGTPVQEFSMA